MSLETLNHLQKVHLVEPSPFRIDYQKKGPDDIVSKINEVKDASLNVIIGDIEEEKVVASEDYLGAYD
jgi:hypothetical protein